VAAVRSFMDVSAQFRCVCVWVGGSCVTLQMKVLPGAAGPVATAPAGVVYILGGITEVCRHLPCHLELVDVFGRKPRFGAGSA
jgi:hypothetical protein